MIELHKLQSEFTAALLDPCRALPADVTSHTARHPTKRFSVYRNNVLASLADVLQAYFPVVARLVGEKFFRAMAREFIRKNPPGSPILSRFGARLPGFIATFGPTRDLPYLADVARLEWLQLRAYHAPDGAPLAAHDLAAIPKERAPNVVFEMHPSAGLFVSRFPVVSIWRTNTLDADVKPINLDEGGEAAIVVRPQLDVGVVSLPAGADLFVAMLMKGHTVAEAADASIFANRHFDLRFSLALLIEAGAIVGFQARRNAEDNRRGRRQP